MIAQVYVDVGVPHLDRRFDYSVPADLESSVRPGIRVKVVFNNRTLSGFVVGLCDTSDHENLSDLSKVVSEEVVMPEESVRLIRAVADHCAGTFMDVARLAIPPRYARAEKVAMAVLDQDMEPQPRKPGVLDLYPYGSGFRQALRQGKSPRTAWTLAPTAASEGDWVQGLTELTQDTVAGGRGVLILVPDAKDCERAVALVSSVMDPQLVVSLSAAKGPQARYTAFLKATRGQARVVIGTRAAAYTPVRNLGLIAVWDESDSSFNEPHFPYPSVRDLVAIRATQTGCAVVFASYSRSTEIENWVDRDWLKQIHLPTNQSSFLAPQIRVASQDDRSLDRDQAARVSRLPHDAFAQIRAGLKTGPVLVAVPWVGHRRNFLCTTCGDPMKCPCGGGFSEKSAGGLSCQVCGSSAQGWMCACGGKRWKALTIGSVRTAEELMNSFKTTQVLRSDSATPIETLPSDPALVIATPGCEPKVEGGYSAAVILDAADVLARPDIRAGEKAVHRWLTVFSLVKPGKDGGSVLIVGPPGERAIQAVLRCDPVGFAARELEDRREAGFPPATRMATFVGADHAVAEAAKTLGEAGYVEVLGPVHEIDSDQVRLIARVPASRGRQFAELVSIMAIGRSSSKRRGMLTWRLDPDWLGG